MIENVMLDAKLGLFAVLLAFAISTTAQEGINPEAPDFVVVTWTESIVNSSSSLQCEGPNGVQTMTTEKAEISLPGVAPMRSCLACVFPADQGEWRLRVLVNVQGLSVRTRSGLVFGPENVSANQQIPVIRTR